MGNYRYHCSQCQDLIEVSVEHVSFPCICPTCSHVQVPAPTRQQVTNQNMKSGLLNGYAIAVAVALVMGVLFSGILPLLIGAAIGMAVIILPVWVLTNLFTDSIFGNQQGYQDYRRNGGSPFWDNFLSNETEHYVLPRPEPEYKNFVPAGHWRYQCNTCNARVENDLNPCWNCGVELRIESP